ncbi:MAG: hypothetical protein CVU80_01900, partial [Elusimicrobia bacterium HGW-Elusimicrobia-4]
MAVTFLSILIVTSILVLLKMRGVFGERGSFYAVASIVLIALIPNITVTDTEHFLLALPLVVMLTIILQQRPWRLFHWLIIAAFILYGFNWFDLWGRKISTLLYFSGVLGIGNAGIIALSLWHIKKSPRLFF